MPGKVRVLRIVPCKDFAWRMEVPDRVRAIRLTGDQFRAFCDTFSTPRKRLEKDADVFDLHKYKVMPSLRRKAWMR